MGDSALGCEVMQGLVLSYYAYSDLIPFCLQTRQVTPTCGQAHPGSGKLKKHRTAVTVRQESPVTLSKSLEQSHQKGCGSGKHLPFRGKALMNRVRKALNQSE